MANAVSRAMHKLRHSTASSSSRVVHLTDNPEPPAGLRLPWWLAAILAALLTAAVGWLLWLGLCFLAWTVAPQIEPTVTAHLATQGWLLSHGIMVGLPGARVSLVPLGMTWLIAAIGTGLGGWFAAHSGDFPPHYSARRGNLQTIGIFALSYLSILLIARHWSEGSKFAVNWVLIALLLLGIPLLANRERGWRLRDELPSSWRWTLAALPAFRAALTVMLAVGLVVFVLALVAGWDRVVGLHQALQAGLAGSIVLVILQLLYLPNFLLWAASWASGAGLQFGLGSVISPAGTDLGMLPALPVLGAIPAAGPQPAAMVWWTVCSLVAGGAAAWRMLTTARRSEHEWPDFVAGKADATEIVDPVRAGIVGALIGILSGLLLVAVAWLASGNLGNIRLVNIGARLGSLAIMAPTGMGIGGMLTAVFVSWRSVSKAAAEKGATVGAAEQRRTNVGAQSEPRGMKPDAHREPRGVELDAHHASRGGELDPQTEPGGAQVHQPGAAKVNARTEPGWPKFATHADQEQAPAPTDAEK